MQKRILASVLSLVYLVSNVVLTHATEINVWNERRPAQQYAGLPAALPPLSPLPVLPSSSENILEPKIKNAAPQSLQSLIDAVSLSFATVQDVYDGGSKQNAPVLLIQDVHLNKEAQLNTANLLQHLIDTNHIGCVGVEGAFGPFDFTAFRKYSDRIQAKDVLDDLLKQNLIGAPSYVGITSAVEPPVFLGVDDADHYQANVDALYVARTKAPLAIQALTQEKFQLQQRKAVTFPPELLAFDQARTAYHDGQLNLGAYVENLSRNNVETDFVVDQFLEATRMESRINFDQVERERRAVMEKLANALSEQELANLTEQSVAYRAGRLGFGAYYAGVRQLCQTKSVRLDQAPHFADYLRYVLLSDGIKAEQLFEAVEVLEQRVVDTLATKQHEKDLLRASEKLVLAEKLVDFSLTAKEWERYKDTPPNLPIVKHGEEFEKFYREADIRSEKMIRNLLSSDVILREPKATEESKRSFVTKGASQDDRTSILVMGGFHTPLVSQLLRQKKISYVVVSPKLTLLRQGSGGQAEYLGIFAREKTPLDRLFAGEKLFLSPDHLAVGTAAKASALTGLLLSVGLSVLPGNLPSQTTVANIVHEQSSYAVRYAPSVSVAEHLKPGTLRWGPVTITKGKAHANALWNEVKIVWSELPYFIPVMIGAVSGFIWLTIPVLVVMSFLFAKAHEVGRDKEWLSTAQRIFIGVVGFGFGAVLFVPGAPFFAPMLTHLTYNSIVNLAKPVVPWLPHATAKAPNLDDLYNRALDVVEGDVNLKEPKNKTWIMQDITYLLNQLQRGKKAKRAEVGSILDRFFMGLEGSNFFDLKDVGFLEKAFDLVIKKQMWSLHQRLIQIFAFGNRGLFSLPFSKKLMWNVLHFVKTAFSRSRSEAVDTLEQYIFHLPIGYFNGDDKELVQEMVSVVAKNEELMRYGIGPLFRSFSGSGSAILDSSDTDNLRRILAFLVAPLRTIDINSLRKEELVTFLPVVSTKLLGEILSDHVISKILTETMDEGPWQKKDPDVLSENLVLLETLLKKMPDSFYESLPRNKAQAFLRYLRRYLPWTDHNMGVRGAGLMEFLFEKLPVSKLRTIHKGTLKEVLSDLLIYGYTNSGEDQFFDTAIVFLKKWPEFRTESNLWKGLQVAWHPGAPRHATGMFKFLWLFCDESVEEPTRFVARTLNKIFISLDHPKTVTIFLGDKTKTIVLAKEAVAQLLIWRGKSLADQRAITAFLAAMWRGYQTALQSPDKAPAEAEAFFWQAIAIYASHFPKFQGLSGTEGSVLASMSTSGTEKAAESRFPSKPLESRKSDEVMLHSSLEGAANDLLSRELSVRLRATKFIYTRANETPTIKFLKNLREKIIERSMANLFSSDSDLRLASKNLLRVVVPLARDVFKVTNRTYVEKLLKFLVTQYQTNKKTSRANSLFALNLMLVNSSSHILRGDDNKLIEDILILLMDFLSDSDVDLLRDGLNCVEEFVARIPNRYWTGKHEQIIDTLIWQLMQSIRVDPVMRLDYAEVLFKVMNKIPSYRFTVKNKTLLFSLLDLFVPQLRSKDKDWGSKSYQIVLSGLSKTKNHVFSEDDQELTEILFDEFIALLQSADSDSRNRGVWLLRLLIKNKLPINYFLTKPHTLRKILSTLTLDLSLASEGEQNKYIDLLRAILEQKYLGQFTEADEPMFVRLVRQVWALTPISFSETCILLLLFRMAPPAFFHQKNEGLFRPMMQFFAHRISTQNFRYNNTLILSILLEKVPGFLTEANWRTIMGDLWIKAGRLSVAALNTIMRLFAKKGPTENIRALASIMGQAYTFAKTPRDVVIEESGQYHTVRVSRDSLQLVFDQVGQEVTKGGARPLHQLLLGASRQHAEIRLSNPDMATSYFWQVWAHVIGRPKTKPGEMGLVFTPFLIIVVAFVLLSALMPMVGVASGVAAFGILHMGKRRKEMDKKTMAFFQLLKRSTKSCESVLRKNRRAGEAVFNHLLGSLYHPSERERIRSLKRLLRWYSKNGKYSATFFQVWHRRVFAALIDNMGNPNPAVSSLAADVMWRYLISNSQTFRQQDVPLIFKALLSLVLITPSDDNHHQKIENLIASLIYEMALLVLSPVFALEFMESLLEASKRLPSQQNGYRGMQIIKNISEQLEWPNIREAIDIDRVGALVRNAFSVMKSDPNNIIAGNIVIGFRNVLPAQVYIQFLDPKYVDSVIQAVVGDIVVRVRGAAMRNISAENSVGLLTGLLLQFPEHITKRNFQIVVAELWADPTLRGVSKRDLALVDVFVKQLPEENDRAMASAIRVGLTFPERHVHTMMDNGKPVVILLGNGDIARFVGEQFDLNKQSHNLETTLAGMGRQYLEVSRKDMTLAVATLMNAWALVINAFTKKPSQDDGPTFESEPLGFRSLASAPAPKSTRAIVTKGLKDLRDLTAGLKANELNPVSPKNRERIKRAIHFGVTHLLHPRAQTRATISEEFLGLMAELGSTRLTIREREFSSQVLNAFLAVLQRPRLGVVFDTLYTLIWFFDMLPWNITRVVSKKFLVGKLIPQLIQVFKGGDVDDRSRVMEALSSLFRHLPKSFFTPREKPLCDELIRVLLAGLESDQFVMQRNAIEAIEKVFGKMSDAGVANVSKDQIDKILRVLAKNELEAVYADFRRESFVVRANLISNFLALWLKNNSSLEEIRSLVEGLMSRFEDRHETIQTTCRYNLTSFLGKIPAPLFGSDNTDALSKAISAVFPNPSNCHAAAVVALLQHTPVELILAEREKLLNPALHAVLPATFCHWNKTGTNNLDGFKDVLAISPHLRTQKVFQYFLAHVWTLEFPLLIEQSIPVLELFLQSPDETVSTAASALLRVLKHGWLGLVAIFPNANEVNQVPTFFGVSKVMMSVGTVASQENSSVPLMQLLSGLERQYQAIAKDNPTLAEKTFWTGMGLFVREVLNAKNPKSPESGFVFTSMLLVIFFAALLVSAMPMVGTGAGVVAYVSTAAKDDYHFDSMVKTLAASWRRYQSMEKSDPDNVALAENFLLNVWAILINGPSGAKISPNENGNIFLGLLLFLVFISMIIFFPPWLVGLLIMGMILIILIIAGSNTEPGPVGLSRQKLREKAALEKQKAEQQAVAERKKRIEKLAKMEADLRVLAHEFLEGNKSVLIVRRLDVFPLEEFSHEDPESLLKLIYEMAKPQYAYQRIGAAEFLWRIFKILPKEFFQRNSGDWEWKVISPLRILMKEPGDANKVHGVGALGRLFEKLPEDYFDDKNEKIIMNLLTALVDSAANSNKEVRLEIAWALVRISARLSNGFIGSNGEEFFIRAMEFFDEQEKTDPNITSRSKSQFVDDMFGAVYSDFLMVWLKFDNPDIRSKTLEKLKMDFKKFSEKRKPVVIKKLLGLVLPEISQIIYANNTSVQPDEANSAMIEALAKTLLDQTRPPVVFIVPQFSENKIEIHLNHEKIVDTVRRAMADQTISPQLLRFLPMLWRQYRTGHSMPEAEREATFWQAWSLLIYKMTPRDFQNDEFGHTHVLVPGLISAIVLATITLPFEAIVPYGAVVMGCVVWAKRGPPILLPMSYSGEVRRGIFYKVNVVLCELPYFLPVPLASFFAPAAVGALDVFALPVWTVALAFIIPMVWPEKKPQNPSVQRLLEVVDTTPLNLDVGRVVSSDKKRPHILVQLMDDAHPGESLASAKSELQKIGATGTPVAVRFLSDSSELRQQLIDLAQRVPANISIEVFDRTQAASLSQAINNGVIAKEEWEGNIFHFVAPRQSAEDLNRFLDIQLDLKSNRFRIYLILFEEGKKMFLQLERDQLQRPNELFKIVRKVLQSA